MSEFLTRARRNLSIGAYLGHECAMAALREAFAEIDRLTARADELLEANNAEVERRRQYEAMVDQRQAEIEALRSRIVDLMPRDLTARGV